jgi:two-component system chemotaxis response regulator CheB
MDGLTFLKRLMHFHPLPTIVISSLTQSSTAAALDALRSGAVDVLAKPSGPFSVGELRESLATRIRAAASARPAVPSLPQAAPLRPHPVSPIAFHSKAVLAIGASTGGTVALQDILLRLPADIPGTVIAQHIPAGFSLAFAQRLNRLCPMEVREAVQGDLLHRGLALVAPGDFHLMLRTTPAGYAVELQQGPPVCFQRPSVDVMFASVAQAAGARAVGVLLTGMGNDGAKGMLALKRAGAATLAQDEASCVVYGMPREAVRLGAVDTIASLNEMPACIAAALVPHRDDFSRNPNAKEIQ